MSINSTTFKNIHEIVTHINEYGLEKTYENKVLREKYNSLNRRYTQKNDMLIINYVYREYFEMNLDPGLFKYSMKKLITRNEYKTIINNVENIRYILMKGNVEDRVYRLITRYIYKPVPQFLSDIVTTEVIKFFRSELIKSRRLEEIKDYVDEVHQKLLVYSDIEVQRKIKEMDLTSVCDTIKKYASKHKSINQYTRERIPYLAMSRDEYMLFKMDKLLEFVKEHDRFPSSNVTTRNKTDGYHEHALGSFKDRASLIVKNKSHKLHKQFKYKLIKSGLESYFFNVHAYSHHKKLRKLITYYKEYGRMPYTDFYKDRSDDEKILSVYVNNLRTKYRTTGERLKEADMLKEIPGLYERVFMLDTK